MKNLGTISKENILSQLKTRQMEKVTGGAKPEIIPNLGRSRSRSRSRSRRNTKIKENFIKQAK